MISKTTMIGPRAIVFEAAKLMRENRIGSVVVVNGGSGEVLGIITERDLVRRVLAENKDVMTVKVSDVMTTPVVSIAPNEDIVDAAQLMRKNEIRRLVVMEGGKLIGIITANDIANNMKQAVDEFATALYLMGQRTRR